MAEEARRYSLNRTPCGRTRREFLWEVGGGFAGLALIDLLSNDGFFLHKCGLPQPVKQLACSLQRRPIFRPGPNMLCSFS